MLTREYIDSHLCIKTCLAQNLINLSSLSRQIIRDLKLDEKEEGAIRAACNRHIGSIDQPVLAKDTIHNCAIDLKMKVGALFLKKDSIVKDMVKNINNNAYYTLSCDHDTIQIIGEESLLDKILEDKVMRSRTLYERRGMIAIVVFHPYRAKEVPGIIAQLSWTLASNSINIISLVSTLSEITFCIDDKDGMKGLRILSELIKHD